MKERLYLINDFSHDLFTGLWIACFYLLFRLQYFDKTQTTTAIGHEFFYMQSGAMILIIITGIIRAIHVKSAPRLPSQQIRKDILLIKHIIMGLLFVAGTIFSFRWGY